MQFTQGAPMLSIKEVTQCARPVCVHGNVGEACPGRDVVYRELYDFRCFLQLAHSSTDTTNVS
jgi:hypothetical protein